MGAKATTMMASFNATWLSVKCGSPRVRFDHTNTIAVQGAAGPPTHTAKGRVDLAAIARGAGLEHAYTVHDLDSFERHCAEGLAAEVGLDRARCA